LSVPDGLQSDAVLALRLGAVSFGINLVMGIFSAVPRALQRFDIVNLFNVIIGTLQIVVTVLLLAFGKGLISVVLWGVSLSVLSLVTYIVVAKRLLPAISVRPRFDSETFSELFKFSGFVMASNFTGVASAHSEKLILGGLAPIAQVTYYTVPFNLASRVLTLIPNNLFTVLFPAFSAMSVTDNLEVIREAYARAFRFIFIAVAPISVLMIVFGGDLLRLWIDEDMSRNGGPILACLAVAVLINAPAWVSVTVGQSMGRPALVAISQMIHLAALIVCGLILVPFYGAFGAALAWLAGNCIGIPVLVLLVNRYALSISTAQMLKGALLRPFAAMCFTLGLAIMLKPLVHGALSLALAAAAVTAFYAALTYLITLNLKDKEIFKSFVADRYRWTPKVVKEQA
jgi:O-antigen/teichoic acid export membrane protein